MAAFIALLKEVIHHHLIVCTVPIPIQAALTKSMLSQILFKKKNKRKRKRNCQPNQLSEQFFETVFMDSMIERKYTVVISIFEETKYDTWNIEKNVIYHVCIYTRIIINEYYFMP